MAPVLVEKRSTHTAIHIHKTDVHGLFFRSFWFWLFSTFCFAKTNFLSNLRPNLTSTSEESRQIFETGAKPVIVLMVFPTDFRENLRKQRRFHTFGPLLDQEKSHMKILGPDMLSSQIRNSPADVSGQHHQAKPAHERFMLFPCSGMHQHMFVNEL